MDRRSLFIALGVTLFLGACKPTPPPATSLEPPPLSGSGALATKEAIETKAVAGDMNAQFELGAMYQGGDEVEKDLKLAREWFEKAAKQDESRSQFNLGVMEYTGEDTKQNFAKAKEWFEKSAKQGNTRSLFNLGVMHYRGEGMKQNFPAALEYFTKAGHLGYNEAQFNLGVMFLKGEGTEIDVGQAYAWFEAARAYGNPRASDALAEIESQLTPEQIQAAKNMGEDLKKEIAMNVAAAVAAGQLE